MIDINNLPPPPKWATYRHYRAKSSDFKFHTRLSFAKSAVSRQGGTIFEWTGNEWENRIEMPYTTLQTEEQRAELRAITAKYS